MTHTFLPTTREIKDCFGREIAHLGGTVSDTYDDGRRLFLRSILPGAEEVRPGDRIQAGVALRVTDSKIWVHPYTFRQVCRNGAIMAQALGSHEVERVEEEYAVEGVLAELADAVQACAAPESFAATMDGIRSAAARQADMVLNVMPMLARLSQQMAAEVLEQIAGRFLRERDRSAFGLMNAVTSLARDTREPEMRWRLEEFGGGVPALLKPVPDLDDAAAELMRA